MGRAGRHKSSAPGLAGRIIAAAAAACIAWILAPLITPLRRSARWLLGQVRLFRRRAPGGYPAVLPGRKPPQTTAATSSHGEINGSSESASEQAAALTLPSTPHERRLLLLQLNVWSRGAGGERLRAMAVARRWGHPVVLPLLRRGLRDADPAVMREAAWAMEVFRGKPGSASIASRPDRPPGRAQAGPLPATGSLSGPPLPRNVSRTR